MSIKDDVNFNEVWKNNIIKAIKNVKPIINEEMIKLFEDFQKKINKNKYFTNKYNKTLKYNK